MEKQECRHAHAHTQDHTYFLCCVFQITPESPGQIIVPHSRTRDFFSPAQVKLAFCERVQQIHLLEPNNPWSVKNSSFRTCKTKPINGTHKEQTWWSRQTMKRWGFGSLFCYQVTVLSKSFIKLSALYFPLSLVPVSHLLVQKCNGDTWVPLWYRNPEIIILIAGRHLRDYTF